VKLLADIEIYVDGIASMQIQNLNTLVDMARVEITEKYQPGGEEIPTPMKSAVINSTPKIIINMEINF